MRPSLAFFLILFMLHLETLAQERIILKSENYLELGDIVSPYSLEKAGNCPVDKVLYLPNKLIEKGNFHLPRKEITLAEKIQNSNLADINLLYQAYDHESHLNGSSLPSIDLIFKSEISGPIYRAVFKEGCHSIAEDLALIDEITVGAHFQVRVKIYFSDQTSKEKALKYQKLGKTNLFSLFIKLKELDEPPKSLRVNLSQVGGQGPSITSFFMQIEDRRKSCTIDDLTECLLLIEKIYTYLHGPSGLEAQIRKVHEYSEEGFASELTFNGTWVQTQKEKNEQSLQAIQYVYDWKEVLSRIRFNQYDFLQGSLSVTTEIIKDNLTKVALETELCLFNWGDCDLNWFQLKESLKKPNPTLWQDIDFIMLCKTDSSSLFFQGMQQKYGSMSCEGLHEFIRKSKELDMSEVGQWDGLHLRFFRNIEVIDLRGTEIYNPQALEHLSGLKKIIINQDTAFWAGWLQIINPELAIIIEQ